MDSTYNGVRLGFLPNTSAATPETCGVAIDVRLRKSHEDECRTSEGIWLSNSRSMADLK
jgi:hypothetical protein